MSILDGLAFVAATAAGLAMVRFGVNSLQWGTEPGGFSRFADRTRMASCVALMWSLAFLPIRLRKPRPTMREVARQPGMIACCATYLSVVLCAIVLTPVVSSHFSRPSLYPAINIFVSLGIVGNHMLAHSVAAAWMALALTGVWRHERGWIDRLGVALGAFWIMALLVLVGASLL